MTSLYKFFVDNNKKWPRCIKLETWSFSSPFLRVFNELKHKSQLLKCGLPIVAPFRVHHGKEGKRRDGQWRSRMQYPRQVIKADRDVVSGWVQQSDNGLSPLWTSSFKPTGSVSSWENQLRNPKGGPSVKHLASTPRDWKSLNPKKLCAIQAQLPHGGYTTTKWDVASWMESWARRRGVGES